MALWPVASILNPCPIRDGVVQPSISVISMAPYYAPARADGVKEILEWEEVLALLPEATEGEICSWAKERAEELFPTVPPVPRPAE